MSYEPNKVRTYESYDHMGPIDQVVDKYKMLRLNDEQYRKLHCWHAKRLGVDRFEGLAKEAIAHGKNPGRYFTYLLKVTS